MTDTALVFENAQPWRILVAVLLAGTVFGLSWLGLQQSLKGKRKVWLLSLRFCLLMLLVLFFLEPGLQQRKLSPMRRHLAVLVDASHSMQLPVGPDDSRMATVQRFFQKQTEAWAELNADYDLALFLFDSKLFPSSIDKLALLPTGSKTDLSSALTELLEKSSTKTQLGNLAGLLVVSDGADNVDLGRTSGSLPARFQSLVRQMEVPINAIAVGASAQIRDLSISAVASDDFAFIRNAVEVEVEVSSVGLDETRIPVVLEQGGRNLASQTVVVKGSEVTKVKLKFVPDRVGKFTYRVSVPQVADESMVHNNEYHFVTRIIRDKVRVLHLVGRPAWDERFLRQELKRNPNVDLVSFFILRTTTDIPGVSQDELSLIPFPVSELFGSELPTFDVVIFQNFNHGPYQVTFFLPELHRYVTQGGAFLMIGGDLSFGSGGYANSPIEDILGLQLRSGHDVRVQEFRTLPTSVGINHPILDLGSANIWEKMQPLGSYNHVQAVDPDTLVLLEHPFERSSQRRAPILAIREIGRGRTASVLTDGTWRWSFLQAGHGQSLRTYHRFYNNLLRWLIQDPGLQSISLRSDSGRYLPNQPVRLHARYHTEETTAQFRLELVRDLDKQLIERRLIGVQEDGRAEFELAGLPPGSYQARLQAIVDNKPVAQTEDAFVVAGTGPELGQPEPNPSLLQLIADETGGRYQVLEEANLSQLSLDSKSQFRVDATMTSPLLRRYWAFGCLVLLAALEWWLRRRWGFA